MILTGITVDCRISFARERGFDLGLRRFGNELVLLSEMHQQGRVQAVDLVEIFFGIAAVISDGGVDGVARGRQEGHQRAEAITQNSDFAVAFGQIGHNVGGVLNVLDAGVSVDRLDRGEGRAANRRRT